MPFSFLILRSKFIPFFPNASSSQSFHFFKKITGCAFRDRLIEDPLKLNSELPSSFFLWKTEAVLVIRMRALLSAKTTQWQGWRCFHLPTITGKQAGDVWNTISSEINHSLIYLSGWVVSQRWTSGHGLCLGYSAGSAPLTGSWQHWIITNEEYYLECLFHICIGHYLICTLI